MASLDSLPADHRAVLQLVLQRGRSYDDIAQLLSIDRAAVRARALSALGALGPETGVPAERRALITDYLLGQLPPQVSDATRDRLAENPGERAWARVVASELAPLASGPLPEIPAEASRREPAGRTPARAPGPAAPRMSSAGSGGGPAGDPADEPPSSRAGGAVLLAGGVLLIVAVVVAVILLTSGGSSHKTTSTAASVPTPTTTSPTGTTTATTSTSTATAKPIAQVNLLSPTGAKTPIGAAVIVKQGNATGLVIRASGMAANTRHDAYAVWLYNSPSDNHILGFVNPGVTSTKVLQTTGPLPANAAHFKQLLVTIETQATPKAPGKIVLEGALRLR